MHITGQICQALWTYAEANLLQVCWAAKLVADE